MTPPCKPPSIGRWSSTSCETGRADPQPGSQFFLCLEEEPLVAEEESLRPRREPLLPRKGFLKSLRGNEFPLKRFLELEEEVEGPNPRPEGERRRRLIPVGPGSRPGSRVSMSLALLLSVESREEDQPSDCISFLPWRTGDFASSSRVSKGKSEGHQREEEIRD